MIIKIEYEVRATGYQGSFKDSQGYDTIFSGHNSMATLQKSIEEHLGPEQEFILIEKEDEDNNPRKSA